MPHDPTPPDDRAREDSTCLSEGKAFPLLGPNYFASRAIANRFMAQFEDEHFKSLVDSFVEKFKDELWGDIQCWMLGDVECGLGDEIWHRIDRTVEALLSGEQWALSQYVTEKKYGDGEKIRMAIATLIPADLQDKRVADLEAANARLETELKWARKYL